MFLTKTLEVLLPPYLLYKLSLLKSTRKFLVTLYLLRYFGGSNSNATSRKAKLLKLILACVFSSWMMEYANSLLSIYKLSTFAFQPQPHQTLIIEEFEPDVFRQLIEYIHTGYVTLQPRTLLGNLAYLYVFLHTATAGRSEFVL
jgi:hypothetical protein